MKFLTVTSRDPYDELIQFMVAVDLSQLLNSKKHCFRLCLRDEKHMA